ncbi:type VI secretion system protein TssA [Pseudoduganella rhizocola]|uniref:type VI secretion system protein TssA n=1 Tax=Pseudoduganella rhizocola TaxID=3382643 RepID=UPI0038B484BC
MPTDLDTASDAFFQAQLNMSLEALLAPVDSSQPAGRSLRGSPVYSAIAQARRQDDASLPMGGWEHELKRADWRETGRLCAHALATQSKDLQLAAWLLEAQVKQSGFQGIGPCFHLMQELCRSYWAELYPKAAQDELEYRANIFQWINEKLLPTIRMVPLASAERQGEYCWADWELARRQEQVRAALPPGQQEADANDGPSCSQVMAGIGATPTAFHVAQRDALSLALSALDALTATIDPLFGDEAPGMQAVEGILQQILSLVEAELNKRGVHGGSPPAAQEEAAPQGQPAAAPAGIPNGAIRDRAEAYARLAETADYLMRLEPHSPVPYLVRRATEWGRLNTVELYQELFLRLNGQLNIFEMLGLEAEIQENTAHA